MKNDNIEVDSVTKQTRIIFAVMIPTLLCLYLFRNNTTVQVAILSIIGLFVAIYFIGDKIYNKCKRLGLEKWAKEKKLEYENKIKISFFSLSSESRIEDIIWGELKGERIFIFNIQNIKENHPDSHGMMGSLDLSKKWKFLTSFRTYYNGNLYELLSPEDLDGLAGNVSNIKPFSLKSIFENEMVDKNEIIMLLMADIFIQTGNKIEFDVIKNIYKLIKKHGIDKKNIYNGDDSVELLFSEIGSEIDRDIIKNIFNSCQYYKDEQKVDLFDL